MSCQNAKFGPMGVLRGTDQAHYCDPHQTHIVSHALHNQSPLSGLFLSFVLSFHFVNAASREKQFLPLEVFSRRDQPPHPLCPPPLNWTARAAMGSRTKVSFIEIRRPVRTGDGNSWAVLPWSVLFEFYSAPL